jgi:GNAT superfamily N-acetyltransferase
MPQPVIRIASLADAPAVAALIRALESHYAQDGRSSPAGKAVAMVEASIASQEGTRYALAVVEGRPVGLACFAVLRPGYDLAGLIYLKELFIEREARGQMVGAALLAWLADYARAHGIGRIDLTTDSANTGAQAFYERLGAQRQKKVVYRFELSDASIRDSEKPCGQETA